MPDYGQVMYQRAVGEAQEMESSKATAHVLDGILQHGDRLLDVGCGAGHYLRTLRRSFSFPFHYTGIDATQNYVDLAKKAFADDGDSDFHVGDIERLPVDDQSYDVVTCCNVLLHLPRIAPAIAELWRCAKRTVVIRMLAGDMSFRIKQVREWEEGHDNAIFDADGEPLRFHYFNIYSKRYVESLCKALPGVASCVITDDRDFDPAAFDEKQWPEKEKPQDLTRMLGGMQRNGYILQPWAFIRLDR